MEGPSGAAGASKKLKVQTPVSPIPVSETSHSRAPFFSQGRVLCSVSAHRPMYHSSILVPVIKEAFHMADMSPGDIDLISVTSGPGSFTGLRIGLSTAKALAYGWGVKLVSVSTLEVMAETFRSFQGLICPLLDARRERVYAAAYKRNQQGILDEEYTLTGGCLKRTGYPTGRLETVIEGGIYNIDEFVKRVVQTGSVPVLFMGDYATKNPMGIDAILSGIIEDAPDEASFSKNLEGVRAYTFAPDWARYPGAVQTAWLGSLVFISGQDTEDPLTAKATYLAPPGVTATLRKDRRAK